MYTFIIYETVGYIAQIINIKTSILSTHTFLRINLTNQQDLFERFTLLYGRG